MGIDIAAGEAHLRELVQVRRTIADYFAPPGGSPAKWRETVLLVESHYQGRRFDFADGAAVWSPGEGSIAILKEGKLVECLPLAPSESPSPSPEPLARAA